MKMKELGPKKWLVGIAKVPMEDMFDVFLCKVLDLY